MTQKPPSLPRIRLSQKAKEEWQEAVSDIEPYMQTHAELRWPDVAAPRVANSMKAQELCMPAARSPDRKNAHNHLLVCGEPVGIDRATLRRLKRGQMPIDRTLDLHGMTQPQAREALSQTIIESFAQGHKLLLVITGKGRISEQGILKSSLAGWLNEDAIRPYVLAFHLARREDGGSGAFYVLMKKNRKVSP